MFSEVFISEEEEFDLLRKESCSSLSELKAFEPNYLFIEDLLSSDLGDLSISGMSMTN